MCWIYGKDYFVALTQYRDDPKCLMVRGRVRGDIEKLLPNARPRLTDSPQYDYRYRVVAARNDVAAAVAKSVLQINYGRFKMGAVEKRRLHAYGQIWDASYFMQLELAEQGK